MKEIWKDIKGYEGMYQCSNLGRIKTLDRYIKSNVGLQKKRGQLIKPRLNKNGYLQVGLNKDAKRNMCYVHKLVAETFLEERKDLDTVNHIDGDKLNNEASNLEWCTYSDNNLHSYEKLNRRISRNGCTKVEVFITDTLKNETIRYESISETSKNINLSETQIRRYIDKNKKWKERYLFTSSRNKCVEDNERIS